ncbi:MAG: hypothetical protein ABI972_15150 [Acidobacteriota bacterium]
MIRNRLFHKYTGGGEQKKIGRFARVGFAVAGPFRRADLKGSKKSQQGARNGKATVNVAKGRGNGFSALKSPARRQGSEGPSGEPNEP